MLIVPESFLLGMRYAALRTLLAVATGITLSRVSGLSWWTGIILIVTGLILIRWSRGFTFYAIISGLAFLYAVLGKPLPPVADVYRLKQFQGVVIEEPLANNRLTIKLLPPFYGMVRVFLTDSSNTLHYGDIISVQSKIKPLSFPRNPGLPDYNQILSARGVIGSARVKTRAIKLISRNNGNLLLARVVMPARRFLYNTIKQHLPPSESALLLGILLGDKTGLPPRVQDAFTDAGVLHLMAVSGIHVGIVILTLSLLLTILRIRGWTGFIILTIATLFYILLAGWQPSAVRAGIMSWAVLLSVPVQRRVSLLAGLCFATLIILLLDPDAFFHPGTQLSFAATAAIITVLPGVKPYLQRLKPPESVQKMLLLPTLVSLAATIGTAPLLLHHFYRFQPLTFLANLFVVPLTTTALPLGLLTTIGNLFSPQLASILSETLRLNLTILLFTVDKFSKLNVLMIEPGKLPVFWCFYIYFIILLALNLKSHPVIKTVFRISLLLGLVFIVWSKALKKPETRITFFDPGRGDAILFEDTLGRKVMVDAGIDGTGVPGDYLLYRGIKYIDAVIITHPDRDHYGGLLELPKRTRIGQIIVPTLSGDTVYKRLLHHLQLNGTKIVVAGQGDELKGFGYTIKFLYPDPTTRWLYNQHLLPTNSISLVTLFQHYNFNMLLTGDCELPAIITKITPGVLKINLLKSPHHGSKKGNPPELFNILKPEYVIVMGRYPTPAGLETILPNRGVHYRNARQDGGFVITLRSNSGSVLPVLNPN